MQNLPPEISPPFNEVESNSSNHIPTSNPSMIDDFQEDLEKIKGDAIGDTLYSTRFVLKTLIELSKYLTANTPLDENLEKDLCILWDMSIERDVVKLLLDHNVLELFSSIISITNDQRLTEILLGIIGNMCALNDTRDMLCVSAEIMISILELISCSDSLILLQLMRLLHAALVFENSGDEITWFQHFRTFDGFVNKFSFLLVNSMSNTLLVNAYEALNAICSKFAVIEIQPGIKDSGFRDVFVQPDLVAGVIEAFKQMLPGIDRTDETSTPTQNSQKIMNLFLDINVILSQYETISKQCYEPYLSDLLRCISQILEPMCQPIYLFPVTSNEQGFIENINEIIQALGDPYDGECFSQMIRLWSLIDENIRKKNEKVESTWDHEDESDNEINVEDVAMTILEFLTRTSKMASMDDIEGAIRLIVDGENIIVHLYETMSSADTDPDIVQCCAKLRLIIKSIWNKDLPQLATV